MENLGKLNVNDYKTGDIVVWEGSDAAILRITETENLAENFTDCVNVTEDYDSCHISFLRKATPEEVKELGDLNIKLL